METFDDLLQKIKKEEKNTKHFKKEFEELSPKLKILSNGRRLVERWRDHAEAWLKISKKLLQRQLTGEVDVSSRSEMSKSVREAIKAYAEATKALTMIPPSRERVDTFIIQYFNREYPGILQSFSEKMKEFEPLRQAYFEFELKPENVETWEEKLQLASQWKNISSGLLEWKKTTEDKNFGVNKDYLNQLIFPSLQEADTAVMDTVNGLKAFNMVIDKEEKEEIQHIKRVKAETQASHEEFQKASRDYGKTYPALVNQMAIEWKEKAERWVKAIEERLQKVKKEKENPGIIPSITTQLDAAKVELQKASTAVVRSDLEWEQSQKERVAATTIEKFTRGYLTRKKLKKDNHEDEQDGYTGLKKEWLRSKQLYQGSDFQNKTLEERRRIIEELFRNATLFLKKISRQMDDQLYTQVQNSRKTARQVYETLKEGVKKAQKEDDGEEEQEDNDIQLLPHHPPQPQPQPFGPSSVGWYAIMMLLFIL